MKPAKKLDNTSRMTFALVNANLEREVVKGINFIGETLVALDNAIRVEHFHYEDIGLLKRKRFDALVIGPQKTPFGRYDKEKLDGFAKFVKDFEGALVGICGGHQMLAILYGGEVGLSSTGVPAVSYDSDASLESGGSPKRVTGYRRVELDSHEPLFNGLGASAAFRESHFEEVTRLPRDFKVIATSSSAPSLSTVHSPEYSPSKTENGGKKHIEGIRHLTKAQYGVQFHPEYFTDRFSKGKIVLENFVAIVRARLQLT
jgi:GMP synthase (glutamine-hydrolysing)